MLVLQLGVFWKFVIKTKQKIYGIEVGENQLNNKLKNINEIIYFEKLNFLNLKKNFFNEKIDFITCDVSFISSKKIILKIIELFDNNIKAMILLKPQFELEEKYIKKYKGFVNDSLMHKKIIESYKLFCVENSIRIIDIIESPIKGAKIGNTEFLTFLEFNYDAK